MKKPNTDAKRSHHKPKSFVTLKTGKPIEAPPDYLGPMGKVCYQKVVADLTEMGVIDRADSRAIEAYAAAYEEYRKARKVCMDKGFVELVETQSGSREMKRAEAEIMGAAWTRMRSLLPDLYLTPAARTKAPGSGEDKKDDGWGDLIPG